MAKQTGAWRGRKRGGMHDSDYCRAQWLRGRTSDPRLREPGLESCAAVLKPWASFSLYLADRTGRLTSYFCISCCRWSSFCAFSSSCLLVLAGSPIAGLFSYTSRIFWRPSLEAHTRVHARIYTCAHMHRHAQGHVYMHAHTHTHSYTHTHIHIHTYTLTHTHTHTHTLTHTHTHTHTHTLTHTHTHAHTHTRTRVHACTQVII